MAVETAIATKKVAEKMLHREPAPKEISDM